MPNNQRQAGFTVLEAVVVTVCVAILMALVFMMR